MMMNPRNYRYVEHVSTRTQEVYDELRRQLLDLNGDLEPGQRLRLLDLAQRFDASQSVIREALTRLAEQGLVVATPQHGFSVRELSVVDLADLTRTRVQVESLALRQAVQHGGVAWEAAVLAAHHTLERTPVADATGHFNEDWSAAHEAFHRTLLAGGGSPRLEAIVTSLRDSAELYRRWYWALTSDHARDIAGEHRQLRDLAVARKAKPAVAVLTEHIERAPRELIAYAEQHSLDAGPPSKTAGTRKLSPRSRQRGCFWTWHPPPKEWWGSGFGWVSEPGLTQVSPADTVMGCPDNDPSAWLGHPPGTHRSGGVTY
jgi:DNA-binding GntR family transcriptional regulator